LNPQRADDSRVEVLFLTGQPGAGKTAVAKEISDLLWKIREPHAVIDIDELCRGVLPTKTPDFNRSLAVANLSAVWANFYAAGVRRMILARILESQDDLDVFGGAIPGAQVTVCLLRVPEATIQQRITEREPGSSRAFLLSLTTRTAERIASLDLPGIQVDNDQRPVNEVAREILERAGWPGASG
jgi:chloramphenicol 3-O-phosphotransferase